MFEPVNPKQNFPELEDSITAFWKEHNIFEKSVQQRDPANSYVFYDGPPFITGLPHYGHLLGSIAKDVVPRYQTMRGKRVERVWGWDCHGMPIETKVEKELGIKNRREVEEFGIDKFIEQCYTYTRNTSAEWQWYIDKIGRWVDFNNSYKTMDQDYMESVMWNFKQLYDKNLIYEGIRTSLYDTVLGTPISNFEIAMDNSYMDVEDPAITVRFPVISEGRFNGKSILAWTTTPWTLPANKALVIDPQEDYTLYRVTRSDSEIERAWLLSQLPEDAKKLKKSQITQAYLEDYRDESGLELKDVRIRKLDDSYTFTRKYYAGDKSATGSLIEKTDELTKDEYVELIKKSTKKVVKTRYYLPLENDLTAEIDVYQNNLQGLIVAEVEFPSPRMANEFAAPAWFGKEVTDSPGVHPPQIADMTIEQVNAINEKHVQKTHDYTEAARVDEVILAEKRAETVLAGMDAEAVETFKGTKLLGLSYEPPFDFIASGPNDHKVYAYEGMVHMKEGVGIVHSAPGFGDIDTEMGLANNLDIAADVISDEGKYTEAVPRWQGIYIKEADDLILADLKERSLLFKSERITHRYPFSPRSGVPLIHKAQHSWFISIKDIRDDLLRFNEQINWVPDHLKYGRFAKGIETAPDWGISRTRFWGTPLPVWQLEEKGTVVERKVIGSRDELREHSTQKITKVVFVRHASRDKSAADGKLNDEGWAQVESFNTTMKDEAFDLIVASDTRRAQQTVEELAQMQGKEVLTEDVFGTIPMREEYERIEADLLEKHPEAKWISDIAEEDLRAAYKQIIKQTEDGLSEFLKAHEGKYILVATHGERIAIIRHIVEGRNLKETLAMDVPYTGTVTMFFVGDRMLDLHRPMIDDITLKGEKGELKRVAEVLDVWMDSASMPYAQKHYPFENKEQFEASYPADYIVEYIGQTRAWFYVMHVLSTALMQKPSFKNVVTTGIIFGTDGRKMSKSYGNYPDPRGVLEQYGAESLRLYLMGSPIMVGDDMLINEQGLVEQMKSFILPLWNSYSFFVTYANMHNWVPADNLAVDDENSDEEITDTVPFKTIESKLDQWIIARLQLAVRDVRIRMDEYNLPAAVRELPEFLSDLSKWYIRRSRDRFADGDQQALDTLYFVLTEFTKLIAPFTPFLAEAMYGNLVTGKVLDASESVHLTDYPEVDVELLEQSDKLMMQMQHVRDVVALGQALRVKHGVKVRQPLSELEVKSDSEPSRDYEFEAWMKELVQDELNVKTVDEEKEITAAPGWETAAHEQSNIQIAMDFNLTEELKREGTMREFVRLVQNLRKKSGFDMGETLQMDVATEDRDMLIVLDLLKADIEAGTGAVVSVSKDSTDGWKTIEVNGAHVSVNLRR
ncbi:MAG: Isoleucine--tRNA ligase [candidate division WS6 bacterium OLB20]|uniref:isoleucine--tRNA ligase n=1 Tax=candidate division WS6 bacterium OLB20 TaxID=1617426 RepID=A0A136LW14_9BACT|nr:MAG: Isoleucine--tRNA ligase [candidate division WS6 bacterium OLB20]